MVQRCRAPEAGRCRGAGAGVVTEGKRARLLLRFTEEQTEADELGDITEWVERAKGSLLSLAGGTEGMHASVRARGLCPQDPSQRPRTKNPRVGTPMVGSTEAAREADRMPGESPLGKWEGGRYMDRWGSLCFAQGQ